MVVVKRTNGETYFWDGIDLRKRIEFARIGLDLCLSNEQIEAELRRSVFDQIAQRDLDATIILNSKTLIERDADFAKFAGRIQLTYIYEEVLGWDIVRDGIGALRAFHQRAFKKYLDHGVAIKRLNPRLLELDLAKLAAALDPSADLEFDFLGIQTLYDRYLIIDKTRKPSRRIETPQFFWMRVSMGLFLEEPAASARTASPACTISTRTAVSAARRRRCSTPARCIRSCRRATSTTWMTRSRASCTAASPRTPSCPSGPAASEVPGPRCAAPAPTSAAPMASPRA
jgi:hypothetical protein